MTGPTPAERLAEVPTGGDAIVAGWVRQLTDLANLADTVPAVLLVGDEPWDALQRLRMSLDRLGREVRQMRPTLD